MTLEVTRLEALRHARLLFEGRHRAITLNLPRAGDVIPLIFDPPISQSEGEQALAAEWVQTLEIENRSIPFTAAQALIARRAELGPFLQARNALYHFACEQGRIAAECPRCRTELELDLLGYTFALNAPAWELTDRGVLLARPYLGVRPADEPDFAVAEPADRAVMAAALRFELPSSRLQLAEAGDAVRGRLTLIDPAVEAAAWARWGTADEEAAPDRFHWRAGHPGFRAILRLSVALRDLTDADGAALEVSPASVERLFLADVHFLDIAYRLARELALARTPARVSCVNCGVQFIPGALPP